MLARLSGGSPPSLRTWTFSLGPASFMNMSAEQKTLQFTGTDSCRTSKGLDGVEMDCRQGMDGKPHSFKITTRGKTGHAEKEGIQGSKGMRVEGRAATKMTGKMKEEGGKGNGWLLFSPFCKGILDAEETETGIRTLSSFPASSALGSVS